MMANQAGPTAATGGIERAQADKAVLRMRQGSLRKVKNPTNAPNEKSLHRQRSKNESLPDDSPSRRDGKGRQFTVANVGGNGMIYLRPLQNVHNASQPQAPLRQRAGSKSSRAVPVGVDKSHQTRDSVWTQSSNLPRRSFESDGGATDKQEPAPSLALSNGTDSTPETDLDAGTLKIVINRTTTTTTTMSESPDVDGQPSLEIPIPHYRLGTPRFSARGTAFLHQSMNTQSSNTGEHSGKNSPLPVGADYGRFFARQAGIEAHAILSRRHSHASPQPYSIQASPMEGSIPSPNDAQTYQWLPSPSSLSPNIYNSLAANPDDPAIVRYSPINGDIIAATPARIIVQITSEAFLDYELLSDFFLTVRAYLPTNDLLSLLLARFEWAINRFDDNGRVIRVRAFAALRHWILNYFSYDFVTDRELRVGFCESINSLSKLVKGRGERGTSDLKLIADLKKCWNGRCSLFWDSLPLAGEGLQELDIQPGGIIGSRDSRLVHQSQLRFQPVAPQPGMNPVALPTGSTSIANWYSAVMEHNERQMQGHARQASGATSRSLPLSPSSEQSVPILSCSIPAKGFKRASPYANKALGIHPIPTNSTGRRVCPAAPSSLSNEQPSQNSDHRRSGSFSDAARDRRAPLSAEVPSGIENFGHDASISERSLLRGHYIPPGGPYVSAVASTPVADISGPVLSTSRGSAHEAQLSRRQGTPNSPAMKGFIGNIRRALSSRHGGANMSYPPGGTISPKPPPALPSLGKSASVPLNVMFQATSSGQLESYRSVRVDLLAAEIYDSFRLATTVPEISGEHLDRRNSVSITPGADREDASNPQFFSDPNIESTDTRLQPPNLRRLNSAMTDSSQSILIVDDTGSKAQRASSSPLKPTFPSSKQQLTGATNTPEPTIPVTDIHSKPAETISVDVGSHSYYNTQMATPRHHIHKRGSHTRRPTSSIDLATDIRHRSQPRIVSQRTSLRRYASYQSTFTKRSMSFSGDTGGAGSSVKAEDTAVTGAAPTRMLRRRPGGDLRANHNVHDLGHISRPKSAGSITTYTDSVRGSDALGFGERITRTFNARSSSRIKIPPSEVSLDDQRLSFAQRRSSQPQKRRPSFETAVARFAHIPDEEEDEGGLEATLQKLEGRYKSPVQSPTPPSFPDHVHVEDGSRSSQPPSSYDGAGMSDHNDGSYEGTATSIGQVSKENRDVPEVPQVPHEAREQLVSTLYAGSDDSYNSVPLLERGIEEDHQGEPISINHRGERHNIHTMEGMSSGEMVQETPSLRRLRHGSVAPTTTTDSFLLDENDEFLSETSSELSLETLEAEPGPWPLADLGAGDTVLVSQHHSPSPPMTAEHPVSMSPAKDRSPPQQNKTHPPDHPAVHHAGKPDDMQPKPDTKPPVQPRHMPFILGCDSEILAQQFTLVEKDALKEVDWRDLVDMRWQNAATSTTNWVDYLLTQDPLGIDLVTARFNIMVKWALSEIVLTENIEERALTIMKYIHVAQQCRKLNNYTTLLQFTIALTSGDCTRLSKTWDRVPEKEKDILQDLEMLVSPRRNFQNLRTEMEKANADQGCIPVVALYIHDLTYNAQKPSHLPGALHGDPLINFERYRSTAIIVKNLLRLIDASTKYNFTPIDGIIERCLWMACLTDEMINHRSRQLEYKSST